MPLMLDALTPLCFDMFEYFFYFIFMLLTPLPSLGPFDATDLEVTLFLIFYDFMSGCSGMGGFKKKISYRLDFSINAQQKTYRTVCKLCAQNIYILILPNKVLCTRLGEVLVTKKKNIRC